MKFGIKTTKSQNDHNKNGIDDYTDIFIGARKGAPYIIHNLGQPIREEDALVKYSKGAPITGHCRFENNESK
ncbi:hypothetical protein CLLI_14770 [Clostridium liquoris]|jgi:uncharacterized protein YijF (DUF1287 family)|uniref:Uncharacterized protein n=1 Tax=Clostridium liquoris TaxID=1289519 RepID=A0A2T0B3Y9_9CLOT|nr:hypothetical protein [Clostridium liquoris]PRR78608.1 hypothetical protein CLLI_14770 [Clostridium liquoris]